MEYSKISEDSYLNGIYKKLNSHVEDARSIITRAKTFFGGTELSNNCRSVVCEPWEGIKREKFDVCIESICSSLGKIAEGFSKLEGFCGSASNFVILYKTYMDNINKYNTILVALDNMSKPTKPATDDGDWVAYNKAIIHYNVERGEKKRSLEKLYVTINDNKSRLEGFELEMENVSISVSSIELSF